MVTESIVAWFCRDALVDGDLLSHFAVCNANVDRAGLQVPNREGGVTCVPGNRKRLRAIGNAVIDEGVCQSCLQTRKSYPLRKVKFRGPLLTFDKTALTSTTISYAECDGRVGGIVATSAPVDGIGVYCGNRAEQGEAADKAGESESEHGVL